MNLKKIKKALDKLDEITLGWLTKTKEHTVIEPVAKEPTNPLYTATVRTCGSGSSLPAQISVIPPHYAPAKKSKKAHKAKMDAKTYQEEALRTLSTEYYGDNVDSNLIHAAMGLVTESGEFLDALKRSLFYDKTLDKVNLREELGDITWYIAIACEALDTDFETVFATNIEKLKARYPEKFTKDKALNRDLKKERKVLEE